MARATVLARPAADLRRVAGDLEKAKGKGPRGCINSTDSYAFHFAGWHHNRQLLDGHAGSGWFLPFFAARFIAFVMTMASTFAPVAS